MLLTTGFTVSGPGCEWKMVFKAVKGNSRHVYDDWMNSGSMNLRSAEAMEVSSSMPYRDGDIIDKWNQRFIKRVSNRAHSLIFSLSNSQF